MENNKNSSSITALLILAIIIIALLLGIISFLIYDKMNTENNNSNNSQSENLLEKNDYNDSDMITNNDDEDEETNNDSQVSNNSENTSSNEGESSTSSSSTTNSATSKSSSKQNPLAIGEWGIASKYVSGEYVDVPAKVTNITRGSSATQEVKQYLTNGSSIYKYEDAKEGMEWAVIEYSIDLTQMDKDSSAKLDTKVIGTGNTNSIKYNGNIYVTSSVNMTSNNFTKGNIETCKFAVQLPIGCTDYLIVLGSASGSQAFFNGK